MEALRQRARLAPQRIVLPESEEAGVLRAARAAADEGVAHPLLLGRPAVVAQAAAGAGVTLDGVEVLDVTDGAGPR